MEVIVKKSLLDYFSSSSSFRSAQHGFRPSFSTLTQLLLSSMDWIEAFNDRVQTDIVYVDFAKAFDVVCRRRLHFKLQAYGIT